ncbi:glycosyltransferase [Parapedobacter lycopersici]|uniref:glycosyltransferase n=1 Tax=Parapedobacter lycopersici TaxID=1864939 RepID=UPI00214D74E9|nr:glycosyltransferase [Parapedobacter lycopersici]
MKNKKIIVCFTASYPYGSRETYFENELNYLAEGFDKVYIVPLYNPYGNLNIRNTPPNVRVWDVVLPQGLTRVILGLFNGSGFGDYFSDFFSQKVYHSRFKLKKWFNSLLIYRLSVKKFRRMRKDLPKDSILYSYWAEVPLFTSSLCDNFFKLTRMHGADFYLDRNKGFLPIRQAIYNSSDYLLPISRDIQHLLREHYNLSPEKVRLSYLGVINRTHNCTIYFGNILKIVSCSHVYPLKRVHLILDALNQVNPNILIEWHHIGDGESMPQLKRYITEHANKNINVTLHGQMAQEDLIEIYQKNYFHWFVNVSTHEGLPVTIMECFSFGIPAIGTDVGGVNEIINEKNGYLIDRDFSMKELARLLERFKSPCYVNKRKHAYETWYNSFNADTNYTQLVNFIHELVPECLEGYNV